MKKCKKCGILKSISNYSINKHRKDGLSSSCKECFNSEKRNKTLNRKNLEIISGEIKTKICDICKIRKRLHFFNRSKKTVDGYLDGCKECKKNIKKNNYKAKLKICVSCKKEKTDFYRSNRYKDGFFNVCIECEKKRSIEYHNEYVKNGEKKQRNYDKVLSKLKKRIRSAISNILKNRGFRKKCKTIEIIGCTIEELRLYLENKFESWMKWENHGLYNGDYNYGWDIDHIIPVKSAKSEKELIQLNHFTNLQPLCSKINRDIKKDKLP